MYGLMLQYVMESTGLPVDQANDVIGEAAYRAMCDDVPLWEAIKARVSLYQGKEDEDAGRSMLKQGPSHSTWPVILNLIFPDKKSHFP